MWLRKFVWVTKTWQSGKSWRRETSVREHQSLKTLGFVTGTSQGTKEWPPKMRVQATMWGIYPLALHRIRTSFLIRARLNTTRPKFQRLIQKKIRTTVKFLAPQVSANCLFQKFKRIKLTAKQRLQPLVALATIRRSYLISRPPKIRMKRTRRTTETSKIYRSRELTE